MKRTKLLSPDEGTEGGDPVPPQSSPQSRCEPPPAPPPAATVVLNAIKSERELQFEADLEAERQAKKNREIRISELEDENHQLKSAPTIKTPAAPAEEDDGWHPVIR
jgi:hypothetical protein